MPDASFDLVVSTLALMDGADLSSTMHGAYRLLKPGGALAFSIIHPCHITPGLRWERDGTDNATGLVVDRCHERTPFAERWRFGDRPAAMREEKSPRTLAD